MAKAPKVSIIMPTYNVEKYFRQCMDSVVNQTLKDIEIIPVDDGSPDNCGKIMDEYAAKDPRIKPIHQPNGGYGKAVNAGIEAATGEYIGIVETDDWCDSDMFEKLYNRARELDLDVCTSGFYTYNSNKDLKHQNKKWKTRCENIEKFPTDRAFTILEYPELFMMHASLWTKLYKTDFIRTNNIRFNETRYASYQDFPFLALVMSKAQKIGVIGEYFYHWRVEPQQSSSTLRNDKKLMIMVEQCEEVKKIIKDHGLYNVLKESMYRHFASANFGFYAKIDNRHKKEYFEKLRRLFGDMERDNVQCRYMNAKQKKILKLIAANDFEGMMRHCGKFSFKDFLKKMISGRANA